MSAAAAQDAQPIEQVGTYRVRLPGGEPLQVQILIDHGSSSAIGDFLSTIDPAELEQTALNRLDCDTDTQGGVTAAMLRELTERAKRG